MEVESVSDHFFQVKVIEALEVAFVAGVILNHPVLRLKRRSVDYSCLIIKAGPPAEFLHLRVIFPDAAGMVVEADFDMVVLISLSLYNHYQAFSVVFELDDYCRYLSDYAVSRNTIQQIFKR